MTHEHAYQSAPRLAALLSALILLAAPSSGLWAESLTITVEGFSDDLGQAVVEVFGSAEAYWGGAPDAVLKAPIVARQASVKLDGAVGHSALRAYHDRDRSDALETLWPGIALEPSGYSRGAWSELTRPDWALVSFPSQLDPPKQLIRLRTNAFVALAQMLAVGLPALFAVFAGLAAVRWLRRTPRPSQKKLEMRPMTDAQSTRLPVLFVFLTLTLNAMGVGLILPVMPSLIREVTGGDIAQAAAWGGILATCYAVMQFLFAPAVGALSDRYGRRPILLVSLAVMAADYVVLALAGSIWLLFAARLVGGITSATQSTATALISDLSKPEERAKNFGLLGAAFGIGFVLGPILGGLLAEFGTRAPFWAAAGLAGLNLAFGASVVQETVTDAIRRPFALRRANPFAVFAKLRTLPGLLPLLSLFFLYEFAFLVFPSTWAYFTQERFGWSAATVGLSLASFGIAMAAVQGGLIGPVLKRLGEARTIVWGFIFNALAFGLVALVANGAVVMLLAPLSALGAVVTPALQGRMANVVADDSQGELQGLLASVRAVAMIFSPFVMTQTFSAFSGADAIANVPGAAFLLAMGLMITALAINAALCRAAPSTQSA